MSAVSPPDGTDIGPPGPSDTRRGPAPPVDGPGDRPGSFALLLFFIVPIAVAVDIFFWWRFMQIASDVWRAPPGVTGWSAVIRRLPAGLLIVSPIEVNDGDTVEDLPTDMQLARVQVTDPTGQITALQTLPPSASYLHNFRTAVAAVRFEANRIGNYQVAVTTSLPLVTAPSAPPNANDEFAVGGSVADWMRPHEWGVAALLFVTVGSSIAPALRTAIQRRRTNCPLPNSR